MNTLVLSSVLKTDTNHLVLHSAKLDNYTCKSVRDEDYPAVIPNKGSTVDGKIIYNLSNHDINVLDEYEGGEYERIVLSIRDTYSNTNIMANVYEWKDKSSRLALSEWDSTRFNDQGFVNKYLDQQLYY